MDCPVCMVDFDDTVRRPHTMPCGHTFCSSCIDNVNDGGKVSCPTCRIEHRVPREGYFPVCYAMEDLLRRLNKPEVTSSAAAATGSRGKDSCVSRNTRVQLGLRDDKIKATISTCQEVQSQLAQYQTTLEDWCEQQQQLEDGLQRIIDQSKTARNLMSAEKSRAAAKMEKLREGEHEMCAVLENVRTVTTEQAAVQTINSADRINNKVRLTTESCVDRFPNVASVSAARKAREVSGAAMETVHIVSTSQTLGGCPTGAAGKPRTDSGCTINDRLHVTLTPFLEANDLTSLSQNVRSRLEASPVFATQDSSGSRERRSTSQLNLQISRGISSHRVNDALPRFPPCLVYLDLCWPGGEPQRVVIHLGRDTPLGRQFVMLCTGEHGPSYASTTLLRVSRKGLPGEHVTGGLYKRNSNTGIETLLPELDDYDYPSSGKRGTVWGIDDTANKTAQFGILTLRRDDGVTWNNVFGKVKNGLEVLRDAACEDNVRDVIITDCGVLEYDDMQRRRRNNR